MGVLTAVRGSGFMAYGLWFMAQGSGLKDSGFKAGTLACSSDEREREHLQVRCLGPGGGEGLFRAKREHLTGVLPESQDQILAVTV